MRTFKLGKIKLVLLTMFCVNIGCGYSVKKHEKLTWRLLFFLYSFHIITEALPDYLPCGSKPELAFFTKGVVGSFWGVY